MRTGRERLLLHFAKAEFFYPQLSIVTGQRSRTGSSTGFKILLFLAVVLLSAGLAFFIHGLGHQIERIEQGFKDHSVVYDPVDPVSVTVTTTLCDDNHRGTWWLEHKLPTATWTPSPETIRLRTASSITPSFIAPSRTDASRPETTSSLTLSAVEEEVASPSGSSIVDEESKSLLPMHHIISVYWPTYDWRVTLEKVMETVDVAWQIFRKVYHYPLDPP